MGSFGFSAIFFASPPPHPTSSPSGTDGDRKFWVPPHQNFREKTLTLIYKVSRFPGQEAKTNHEGRYDSTCQGVVQGIVHLIWMKQAKWMGIQHAVPWEIFNGTVWIMRTQGDEKLEYSIYNPYTPCGRFWKSVPGEVWIFKFTFCVTFKLGLSQRE